MTNDVEDSRQWRDTIETRLGTLEVRVEEEARLRAAMDKDLSGVRVEKNVLQALQDTQSEHTTQLRVLDEKLVKLDKRMQAGFGRVHAGVDAIIDLLGGEPGSAD
jgi:hypothetical protein